MTKLTRHFFYFKTLAAQRCWLQGNATQFAVMILNPKPDLRVAFLCVPESEEPSHDSTPTLLRDLAQSAESQASATGFSLSLKALMRIHGMNMPSSSLTR